MFVFLYTSSYVSLSSSQRERGGEESHKEMPNQLCHSRNISSQECPSFPGNVNCWHIALSKVDKCQTASFLFGLCVAAWPNWPISVKTNNRQRPITECMINKGSRTEIGRQYWNDWFSFHHFFARTLHTICDQQVTKDRNKTAILILIPSPSCQRGQSCAACKARWMKSCQEGCCPYKCKCLSLSLI